MHQFSKEALSFPSISATGCKHGEAEGAMLKLSDVLIIVSLFLLLLEVNTVSSLWFRWLFANGLRTLTSKKCMLLNLPFDTATLLELYFTSVRVSGQ